MTKFARTTDWGRHQQRQKLRREIERFSAQVMRFSNPVTAQQKRCLTNARRCLREREYRLSSLEKTSAS